MREEEAKSDDEREEEESSEAFLLGLNGNGNPRDRDEGPEGVEPGFTIENLLGINDQLGSSRGRQGGGNAMDVNLSLGLGEEPLSSSAALDHSKDECDGDSRNKRPKVESFTR